MLSSSSAWAHAVLCDERTLHVSYCHNPFRYAWNDRDSTLVRRRNPVTRAFLRGAFRRWRQWDWIAAQRTDRYIANSRMTQARIRAYFGRDARVVYPPVDVSRFSPGPVGDHYAMVSELMPHKQIDVAIEAFNRLRLPLIIVGDGPAARGLRRLAGPTVKFTGRLSDAGVAQVLQGARALVADVGGGVRDRRGREPGRRAPGDRPPRRRCARDRDRRGRPGCSGPAARPSWQAPCSRSTTPRIDPAACTATPPASLRSSFREGILAEVRVPRAGRVAPRRRRAPAARLHAADAPGGAGISPRADDARRPDRRVRRVARGADGARLLQRRLLRRAARVGRAGRLGCSWRSAPPCSPMPLPRGRGAWLAIGGLALFAVWTLLSITWAPLAGSAYHAGQLVVLYVGALLAAVILLRRGPVQRAVEPALAAGILIVIGYGISERLLPGPAALLALDERPGPARAAAHVLERDGRAGRARGRARAPRGRRRARAGGGCGRSPPPRRRRSGMGLYLSFSPRRAVRLRCRPRDAGRAGAARASSCARSAAGDRRRRAGSAAAAPFLGRHLAGAARSARARARARSRSSLLVVIAARRRARAAAARAPRGPGAAAAARAAPRAIALAVIVRRPRARDRGRRQGEVDGPPLSAGATPLRDARRATATTTGAWRCGRSATSRCAGVGAGGWAVYWLRYRTISEFAQDAHSLPLQTLAELGVVGLALLAVFLAGVALAAARGAAGRAGAGRRAGGRRSSRTSPTRRSTGTGRCPR